MMELQLMDLPPARLAALRYTGPYGPALGDFWRQHFVPWRESSGCDERAICYGIGFDDPATTPPEACRYDAGIEVAPSFPVTLPARELRLPGGRYAVFRFCGNTSQIGPAWQAMFAQWLPAHGWQVDAHRPCFERYLPGTRTDPVSGLFACQICVPVR